MKIRSTIGKLGSILYLTVLGLLCSPQLGSCQTPITCGQTVAHTTTSTTETDQYSYTGSAGQRLQIALWGPFGCNAYQAVADIYSPSGQLLITLTAGSCVSYNGAATTLALTNSGTYTILVHEAGYRATGSYSLSIQSEIGGGCDSTPIACGQTVTASTTHQSEMDAYSYSGSAGQRLQIALWGPFGCNSYEAGADIYGPGGEYLTSLTAGSCSYSVGAAITLALTNSGTYTILVHEAGYRATGNYSLSIQSEIGGGCDSTPIACGQTVAASTTHQTEMDAYSYSGSAGQQLQIALWGPFGCNSYEAGADIYGPNGQYLTSLTAGSCVSYNGAAITLALTNSGTYTILVHEAGYRATGSYSLSIQSEIGGGCDSTPIACGQTVAASTTHQTEMDAYSYSGSAGQQLQIALWGPFGCNSYEAGADIYGPNGQYLTSLTAGSCVSYNGAAITLALTNSGTYTILVHEAGYRATGSYSLSIQSEIGGGCSSAPIMCGQSVNTNTSYRTEIDAYGFGTGGGTTIFSFGGSGAQFDFYDPTGKLLFTKSPGTSTNILLTDGTYTLLVHNASYNSTCSYGFTTTCLNPCTYTINPTGPASVGATATNGTIAVSTTGSSCDWVATANTNWLHITGGSSGTGSGTVSYSVDANTNTGARSGTITIANWTFVVNQANPVVFSGQDIGTPGAPGSFSYSNGVYTVSGSGEGTDGSADVFYFLSQTLSGDAQIIARLQSLQGGDPNLAEAGVMIRESLDPGAKMVYLSLNASTNVIFNRRLTADDLAIQNGFQGSNYLQGTNFIWLRLMRMGDTFVAHYSTNGLNWQYMWFTTLAMTNQAQVGLEVTADHFGQLATATFDNVSTGGLTPLSGVWPLPGPTLLTGGQDWSAAEFQRIGGYEFLLGGFVGDYFSINTSTNVTTPLSSWKPMGTVTNTYGVVPVLDVQAKTNTLRFYRAQRLGP